MTVLLPRDRLLLRALLASLLVHALVAYIIPAFAVVPGEGPAIETISFVHALPIRIETPHPLIAPPPASAPVRSSVVHVERSPAAGTRTTLAHPRVHAARAQQNQAPIVADSTRTGSSYVQTAATPAPSATAVPTSATVASVETKNDAGGYMPLGAEDPVPVLDPTIRSRLAALGIHTTLNIIVDVNGKTKQIEFDPPVNADAEARIRNLLANASWDPAICGAGVPCESKATIKL